MTDATQWYSNVFKKWPVKQLGDKPTADMLASIHDLGARPGKQALANAMGLRPSGVTGAQIVMACGAPQLNKMRGFIADKLLKRLPAAPDALNHQVYKLEITPKGLQRIEQARKRAAAADEAAKADPTGEATGKAKAKRKGPAKVKAAPKRKRKGEAPAADQPQQVVPVTGDVIGNPEFGGFTTEPAKPEAEQQTSN